MDAKAKPSVEPLKYQTWFLKVSIHCDGCRKKVKKVLKRIDGVFTATIDSQQQKVTVTGNVSVETLLRKLIRAGKPAEIWPESIDVKGKNSGKEKKKKNQNENESEPKETQSLQNKGTESASKCENETKNKNKNSKNSNGELPVKSPAGNNVAPVGGGGGSDNNKKKKKDGCGGNGTGNGNENGNNGLSTVGKSGLSHAGFQFQNLDQGMAHQVNLSPTRQQPVFYPSETCYLPMAYVSSAYNRLYPMGRVGDPSYYVPSLPYTCPPSLVDQYGTYQLQSAPSVSFEFFSDENANGCSVM